MNWVIIMGFILGFFIGAMPIIARWGKNAMRSLMSLIDAFLNLTPNQLVWLLLIEATIIFVIVEVLR